MYITFVVFLSIFFIFAFILYLLNICIKQIKNSVLTKIKNIFIYFSLIIALILIFSFFIKLNFQTQIVINNSEIINIALLSYIFTNSWIITFFIIIMLFSPIRIFYIIQKFYTNKTLWIQYLKKYLLYGTLAILSCTLIYAFSDVDSIFFNNTFSQINVENIVCNQNMVSTYNNLKNIINIIFKGQWTGWIYITYFLILIIISILIIKFKKIHKLNFNIMFKLSNNLWSFTIPMAFSSLICSITLNYQSFIFRNLILTLIISLFIFISYLIYLIFKKYQNKNILNKFNSGVLLPIFFISYLAISNNNLFHESFLININFWITLYIGSFINGLLHFENNQNITLSKFNLSYLTPLVCSGINTSPLLYISQFLDWGLKLNNKISIF